MDDRRREKPSAEFESGLALGIELLKQGVVRRPNWRIIYTLIGSAYALLLLSVLAPILQACVMFPTVAAAALFYVEALKPRS
ncbi:hypothetical protein [Sphingomonas abietis]|uniref:Uncharacterized protein n=1 Tax=Sphingomonas abietis TaxID=3012344 RepID=A0ABY7NLW4_9SPHN|nr:hypothetical protein [Sphingomonas abietis]WBO22508.1 hypothetical protein PBT88_20635 [Sphingomonas abietis]